MTCLNDIEIIVDPNLTETVPYPRSPSRAKRRAAMGHPQCVRTIPSRTAYMIGQHKMVMHPARYKLLQLSLAYGNKEPKT